MELKSRTLLPDYQSERLKQTPDRGPCTVRYDANTDSVKVVNAAGGKVQNPAPFHLVIEVAAYARLASVPFGLLFNGSRYAAVRQGLNQIFVSLSETTTGQPLVPTDMPSFGYAFFALTLANLRT